MVPAVNNTARRFSNDASCLYFRDTRDLGQLRKEGWTVNGQPINDSVWGGVYFDGNRNNNQHLEAPAEVEQYFKPQGNSDFTFFIRFVNYGVWDTTLDPRHLFGTGLADRTTATNAWTLSMTRNTGDTRFRVNSSNGTNTTIGIYLPPSFPSVVTAILVRRNGVFEAWFNGILFGTLTSTIDLSDNARTVKVGGSEPSVNRAAKATVLSIGSWSRALMPEEIQDLSNDSTFGYLPTLPSPITEDNSRIKTLDLSEIQSSDFYLYPTGRLLPRLVGSERQTLTGGPGCVFNKGFMPGDGSFSFQLTLKVDEYSTSPIRSHIFGVGRTVAYAVTGTWSLRINPSGTCTLVRWIDTSVANYVNTNVTINLHEWTHIVVSYNAETSTMTLWKNGVINFQSVVSHVTLDGDSPLRILEGQTNRTEPFNGKATVSNASIYNFALTQSDVDALVKNPLFIKPQWKWGAVLNPFNTESASGWFAQQGSASQETFNGRNAVKYTCTKTGTFSSIYHTAKIFYTGCAYKAGVWVYIPSSNETLDELRLSASGTPQWTSPTSNNHYWARTTQKDTWVYLEGIVDFSVTPTNHGRFFVAFYRNPTAATLGDVFYISDPYIEQLGTTCALLPQNLTSSGWVDASPNNYFGTLSSGTTLRIP